MEEKDKNPILRATETVDRVLHAELDNLLNLMKPDPRAAKVRETASKVVLELRRSNLIPPDARNKLNAGGYPKQSRVGALVTVTFDGDDVSHSYDGTVVRGDCEGPMRTVILLDDGRLVLSDECRWSHKAKDADWVNDENAKRKAILEANRKRHEAEQQVAEENRAASLSVADGVTGGDAP